MRNSESKIKITRQAVESASCEPGKPFAYIMDSEENGFGLRVTPAGNKQYIIRFQHRGRRICRAFAPVSALSIQAARSRAKKLISEYVLGNDPLEEEKLKIIEVSLSLQPVAYARSLSCHS